MEDAALGIQTFINLILAGITLGAVYVLMAMGLNLVYGVTKVFNYAQGAFFGFAGYIIWYLSVGKLHWSYPLAILVAILLMFVFGVIFEKAVVLPLRRQPSWELTVIIVTLGGALFLDNLTMVTFNPLQKTIPSLWEGTFKLGDSAFSRHDFIILVTAVVVLTALSLFLSKTRIGMSMRAVSQDQTGARIVGLPVNNLYSLTFGIAGALSAIAAVLLIPRQLLYPGVGWTVLMKAFVIIVLGGLGSFKGTIVAAFFLAVVEIFVTYFLGGIWALPLFLLMLIIILVFRPKGLFGTW